MVYLAGLCILAALVVWLSRTRQSNTLPLSAASPPADELACSVVARTTLGSLMEASGLALSRRSNDVLWSLNDSGAPVVIALDPQGKMLGRVRINGADVNNWEDVSIAPCHGGSCLYVADTGNGGGTQRNDVVVYRVPEPTPADKETAPADVFYAAYPDGEDHEADAVFVMDERLYLITKGHPSLLFRFPVEIGSTSLATLERLGEIPTERFLETTIPRRTRVTDAETSPDGRWVAIRTNEAVLVYRSADLLAGRTSHFWYANVKPLDEPRGEGVAISNEGDIYVVGEGGGLRPGTFVHTKCTMPQ